MIIKYLSPAGLSKLISKMKAAFSEKNHSHQLSDLSGTVPVSKGGTGATEAAQARTNLGVTPQNIGAMPTGGGTFSGNITVSKTDPYVSLENTGTNNKFGFHVYGDEAGKGVLALYDQTKAKHVFGIYSHSERVVYEWPVDLLSALAIESGGTGANNAAGARANLGITPTNIGAAPSSHTHDADSIVSGLVPITRGGTGGSTPDAARQNLGITPQNIGAAPTSHTHGANDIASGILSIVRGGTGANNAAGALANLGGFPKTGGNLNGGINFGQTSNALSWVYEDGRQWHVRPDADIDVFQVVRVTSDGSAYGYLNIDADGNVTFTNPLGVGAGGTGANSAAGARANLGALATSGGPITGYLQFGTMSNGLEWFTADGTQIHLRPYAPGNSFQITLKGPNTDDQETGAFNISTTGYVTLGRPLGIESGGTGANNAAGARNNLSVPELRNGVVIVANQDGIGTGVSAEGYWQFWNLQDGDTYPAAFCPSSNGRQLLGHNSYRIKAVYANDYPCGTWNGNAIAVAKGGTGATSAAGARANLGIGVADTASGSITYNSAGQQVNFGKTLSKVPIVICIQNGGDFANYKVGNITRTGFTISASATGTTWQYVALCV